jgi:tetratricopeptide (TPR) repeat protein
MRTRLLFPYLLLIVSLFVFAFGCDYRDEVNSADSIKDVPLESYQVELINIAFEAASAMPTNPHIKDRSRLQGSVIQTCLELKQAKRALEYIKQIDNWRRGAAYADLALYYIQHGAVKKKVEPYLIKAAQVADENEDWRRDRIRVKIAQAHILLGQYQQARIYAAGVVDSEAGKVARTKATIFNADSFDKEIEALEKTILSGQYDIVKNTLGAYTELFNRFYTDTERRVLIEEKIKAACEGLPLFVQIDLLMELAGFALNHSDNAKVLELVEEAHRIIDSSNWQPRYEIPLKAKLAELRFRAGDEQRAHNEIKNTLNLFDTRCERIVDIYRAQMLRSIAEAYWTMGDTAVALDLYKRALEAGIENPNSRPRAEDLTATCCSMALCDVEPNEEILSRILKIRDNLSDPW